MLGTICATILTFTFAYSEATVNVRADQISVIRESYNDKGFVFLKGDGHALIIDNPKEATKKWESALEECGSQDSNP